MKRFQIKIAYPQFSSQIEIGPGLLPTITRAPDLLRYSSVHVLIDATVSRHHGSGVLKRMLAQGALFSFPSGEKNKNIRKAAEILEWLHDGGADRNSLLIAIGGGVVTDIAGFVASTYMRGIRYLSVPTTLVGQVDAAIGGKTAVNLGGSKNIAGTFYPPQRIVCAPEFLSTLKPTQIRDGLVEAIKIFAACDSRRFAKHNARLGSYREGADLGELIADAVRLKVEIVNRDPFERGLRRVLNLGHTTGHAYEAVTGESHGKSVALGILIALELSRNLSQLEPSESDALGSAVTRLYSRFSLGEADPKSLWQRIQHDKKKIGTTINFVLLKRCGEHVVKSVNYRQFQSAYQEAQRRLKA